MEQDKLSLFSLIFSSTLILICGAGLLLLVSQLYIPAWQLFLGMNNPWYCSILILFLCPLLGLIRLPLAFRFKGHTGNANMLSTIIPMGMLFYAYPMVQINWSYSHFLPAILSFLLFWVSSFPNRKSGTIYRVSLLIGACVSIIFLNSILGDNIHSFLWMAFATQFFPLLIVDVIRTAQSATSLEDGEEYTLGGDNAHDPLWVAPSCALFLAYTAHILFWNTGSIHI